MRHSWKTRKSNTKQTQNNAQTTTKNKQHNQQQTTSTYMFFCVLFCLLCSILTYKGTRGIVGNKKTRQNNHRQMIKQHNKNKPHTQQQTTTNNNKNIHVCLVCVLFGLLCSLLTYKGACGIVGNKKTKQNKHRTMNNQRNKNKQYNQQQTTTNTCFVFCYVCYVRY